MKLRCHRASLQTAFQIVSGVVPSRTPKEILKNVKLEAADGKATLIGTDQEVGIRYQIPGVGTDSAGETLLPTNRVMAILRELTDDHVEFDITESRVEIRSGHSQFQLSAEDPAEFPPVAEFNETNFHKVPGHVFREAIRRTIFATDVESTRYALGGILLELGSEGVALVATDSRRLALQKAPCKSEGSHEGENSMPVVPRTAMSLIEKSIDDDGEVLVAVHQNDVVVKSGHSTIYSRLVEGRFPRYGDVIPSETTHQIDLVVGPFYAAVRQAQILTNEDSRGVDFHFGGGTLVLRSEASDVGTSKIELPINYDEESMIIKFDPRYISEFLRNFEPEKQVSLHLIDAESAAVFRTDDNYTYVIMPLSREP
jgi:DNA polymerase-3 subunit beta